METVDYETFLNQSVESVDLPTESEDQDDDINADATLEEPPTKKKKATFSWQKREFATAPGEWVPPANDLELENGITVSTPLQYFKEYWTDELFEEMSEKTNMYALMNSGCNLKTTAKEIRCLVGIHVHMGTLGFPRCRLYWQPSTRIDLIADNISLNRFFKLRNNLHVTSDDQRDDRNHLWKVQPVLASVRKQCLKLTPEKQNSVDEQMIPFKGRYCAILTHILQGSCWPLAIG